MRRIWIIVCGLLLSSIANAEFLVSGYVKEMYALYALENDIPLLSIKRYDMQYNMVHQRLNAEWQIDQHWTFNGAMRTRWIAGPMVDKISNYAEMTAKDMGYVDLSNNVYEAHSSFLNIALDRLYVNYTLDRLEVSLGRQRINWGIGMIWNPNDIFNHFSYFDFDYEERSGSDALLATYYTSDYSNIDMAIKVDHLNQWTSALRYRMNVFNYDIQLVGGKLPHDWMFGTGFSGAIGSIAIMGEISCIQEDAWKEELDVVATLEMDYLFPQNSLLKDVQWHAAVLLNTSGSTGQMTTPVLLNTSLGQDVRELSMGKWELFSSLSYPFSPLFSGSVAAMVNPVDGSFYASPSLTYSLSDNFELLGLVQLCIGDEATEYAAMGNIYASMVRLRYSF